VFIVNVDALFVLLAAQSGVGVGDLYGELRRSLYDQLPVLRGHVVGDLCTEGLVAHHEYFQLLHVIDEELLESRGQHVFGLLVGTVPDVWHQHLTLEAPTHSVVNTTGLTPAFRDLDISVRLMANELLCAFLHDLGFSEGSESSHVDRRDKAD